MKKDEKWTPEPFPKPRTFPSGWDGWALMIKNGHQSKEETQKEVSLENDSEEWSPEKFPKPRTYPKNWSIDD